MTQLSIKAESSKEGLQFKVEINKNETSTLDEVTGIQGLSDIVNQILQNAQRRSSLKSDWRKQYEMTELRLWNKFQNRENCFEDSEIKKGSKAIRRLPSRELGQGGF